MRSHLWVSGSFRCDYLDYEAIGVILIAMPIILLLTTKKFKDFVKLRYFAQQTGDK
jgi:hypothetical protein